MPEITETTTYYPPADNKPEAVDHPSHYGGADNDFEVIKVIFAHGDGPAFCRGNALKYILRAGEKDPVTEAEDYRKAAWYLAYLADELEGKH